MARYVLALDQGTTSSRAMLFDRQGRMAASAQHEFPQLYPAPGWVEHDPMAILASQLATLREVAAKAEPGDIAALGIANQRETAIVWDRGTGRPIYNAIVWQDRRTAEVCARLAAEGNEDWVRGRTGLRLDPYFSATKIAWILDHVDGAREAADQGRLAFGTVDSWLLWHLTGGARHATDRTNAARTLLYDIVEDRWHPDLLRLFGIPESMLPDVVWSSGAIATLAPGFGLGEIPIAGIAGDQQAALFGQLCVAPGEAKNTYGTGCFLLRNIGNRFALSGNHLITTLACGPDRTPLYALEGSAFIGGAVVQWLRDQMKFIGQAPDVEALAASVPDSGGVVMVPAFTGLGAPHWDPYASGLIIGLQRGTGMAHIARAALESIAFQVADLLYAMDADAESAATTLRVDGGAAGNDLLMRFQADLLGIPVERPPMLETTALGVASLAGLATGFWSGMDEIAATRGPPITFLPRDADAARVQYGRWREAVERSRGWNRP